MIAEHEVGREPFRLQEWRHDDSTLLPRKSVVLGAKYILFLSVSSPRSGYVELVCVPFRSWIFKMALANSRLKTSRTGAEYSTAVYEIPCSALSTKIL